jgi:hypothetical protein
LAINGKSFASAARAKSILPGVDSLGSETDFIIIFLFYELGGIASLIGFTHNLITSKYRQAQNYK